MRSVSLRPVVLAWAFLVALTGLPYLRAHLAPPPGTTFVGFFYFVDDSYNYLSYVQQAETGSLLFKNKLLLEDHEATLVNLEWWLVGRLSALLGGRPILAYRLFGLIAALALLTGADALLRACGLAHSHRLPALLLVGLGAGLGGVAWRAGRLALHEALDLTTGLFPFLELVANPHFVAGTALLLWSLLAALTTRTALTLLLGTLLGLVRPYDLILLVAIRTGGVIVSEPRAEWARRLLPLAGLAPVAVYNYWVFYAKPTFASFYADYLFPGLPAFAWALGPAALLATIGLARAGQDKAGRHLLVWLGLGVLVVAVHPVTFSLQFLVGIGFPLLAVGALGLARGPAWLTLTAAAAMASTPAVAVWLITRPNPRWYAPAARMEAALALRGRCRSGELAFAPPDIGLYIGGLTPCRAYVSHPAAAGFTARADEVRSFYEASAPEDRARMLDRLGVALLALPGEVGPVPATWLGAATPFRLLTAVGEGETPIGLYERARP